MSEINLKVEWDPPPTMSEINLKVEWDPPPIPSNGYNYRAWDENGDDNSPCGFGRTKAEAVFNFYQRLEEDLDGYNKEFDEL